MSNQNLGLNNNQSEVFKMDTGAKSIDARKRINVLVIETDLEIQYLYKQFFNAMTSYVSYSIVNDIDELDNGNNDLKDTNSILTYQSVFDTIIIDIKMDNFKGIDMAKEILQKLPKQRIIFTTTFSHNIIKEKMEKERLLSPITILQKPFRFSDLLSILAPATSRFEKVKLTDHVLASYSTIQEELRDAVDFIKKGIETNELNLLLIRKDMDVKKTSLLLKSNGLYNISDLLKNKSLIMLKNEEWYIPDGKVDKHRIINQWHDLVEQSMQGGKTGLRAFCMMDCFFENGFSKEVVDYECTLPSQFQIPFIPICAYRKSDLDSLPEQEKRNLIECHNHMMIG